MRPNLTNQYNTPLTPEQETSFLQWQEKNPRVGSTYDYDARGFWASGEATAKNGHATDKWKKPNHPTFSKESVYSKPGMEGGEWGNGVFHVSDQNMQNMDMKELSDYFKQNEPDYVPLFPLTYMLPKGGQQ